MANNVKRNKKKKSSKGKVALTILLCILALLLVGVFGAYSFVNLKLNKINRDVDDTPVTESEAGVLEPDSGETGDDTIAPEDITWDGVNVSVMQDKDVKNILLIGQDRREGETRARSDSMIICTINKKTKKINLTSLMRDMYVPIPGYQDNRINASYAIGGMELLDKVIETNFGIKIDGNVEVDFNGFMKTIAAVGNLDIALNTEEAQYLNEAHPDWNLVTGSNLLTGEQALAYARIRYVGHSDWERTERQRKVLTVAFENIKDLSLTEMMDLADKVLPNFTTDLSNADIMGYVYTVAMNHMSIGTSNRIPVDGYYTNETIRGMEVLVPDLNANSKLLQLMVYGKSTTVADTDSEAEKKASD